MTTATALDPRLAWLAERKTGIGGSDASAVMGCSPWKSTFALWAEKTGMAPADDAETEAMEWGKRLEKAIAEKYAEATGREVKVFGSEYPEIMRHATRPYMIGSLDGLVTRSLSEAPGVLELKTTGGHRGDEWETEAPLHYQVQLQHYLAVTGRRWGSFAVLIGGQKFRWYDVERNDTFVAALEARCEWFWGLVERQEAPPVDDSESTADALRAIYSGESGETIVLGPESEAWVRDLTATKAQIAGLEAQKRGIENKIKAALGSASYGVVPGVGKFSFKTQRREAHAVEASEFRVLRFSTKG